MQKTADMVLYPHMTKDDVKAVLRRVLTWPAGAQQEAVATLRAIKIEWLGDNAYRAAPEELDAIDDADRSGVATDDEFETVLRSFRAV
jgi:hypothetical protein